MIEQKIFKRLKKPKFKRLLLTAAATALVWGFSCRHQRSAYQDEIDRLKTEFLQKENKYQEEIKLLKIKANKFRFYEYDASGLKVSEIEKVRNARLEDNPGVAFEKFRLREPKSIDARKLAAGWKAGHRRFSRAERDSLDKKCNEMKDLLADSLSAYADEGYLRNVKIFRDLVVEKVARQAYRYGTERANLLDESDSDLERRIAEIPSAAKDSYWGSRPYYRKDNEAFRLMSDILQMREFVRYNNAMIDDIKLSYRQMFEASKEPKIEHMRDSARNAAKNKNYAAEFFGQFLWQQVRGR